MNPETIDKLKDVFAPVAEKIGQGAQFGYEIVLRQQYVEGTLGLLYASIILAFVIIALIIARKLFKSNSSDEQVIGIILGTLALFFGSLFISVNLTTAITHFLNPHFYAIQFFMDLIKH